MSDAVGAQMAPIAEQEAMADHHADGERLHPFSLVLALASYLPSFFFGAFPIFFALSDTGSSMAFLTVGLLITFGLTLAMVFAWLKWSRFRFALEESQIRITSGVLSRNSRSIPYERVQDVNIEQNLLARILGLAKVKLETGSGGGSDASLNSVMLDRADAIRDTIRERKAQEEAEESAKTVTSDATEKASPIAAEDDAELIFAMDTKRLVILGLFSFSLAVFAFLFAIFQNFDFLLPEKYSPEGVIETMIEEDVDSRVEGLRSQVSTTGMFGQLFAAMTGLTVLVAIGFLTGLVRVVLRDYGFKLEDNGKAFRRRRGLLTVTDIAMPLHRVQAALVITGPIRRRFGWKALQFQSLASDGDGESDHMAAPLAKQHEIAAIADRAGIDIALDADTLNRVSPTYWLVPVVPLALLLLGVVGFLAGYLLKPLLLWLALVPLVITLLGWLSWRHHLFTSTDRYLHVHNGFWRQRQTILPLRKIQSVDVNQNIIQRIFDKASVTIGVAGGSTTFPLTVHAIDSDTAYGLRGYLLEKMVDSAQARPAASPPPPSATVPLPASGEEMTD